MRDRKGPSGRLLSFALLLALATTACDRSGATADTSDLVRSPTAPDTTAEWRIAAAPRVRIGGTDADTGAYDLYQVAGAHLLSDGRIVVGNGGSAELRWYDSTGRFEKAIGRKGEGPAEFRLLVRTWPMPGDSIAASDATLDRISIFSPSGELVRAVKLEGTKDLSRPNAWGHFSDGMIAGIGSAGGLSLRPELVGKVVGSESRLARFSPDGKFVNGLARLPGRQRYVVSTTGAVKWPFVPFSPDPSYAISGTSVLSTSGSEFLIEERDGSGRVLRRISADVPVQPLTSGHRDTFASEMRQGVRTEQDRVSTERYLAEAPYPRNLPLISRLLPTQDGMLWVESYSMSSAADRRWWVLDRTGHWVGYASTPRRLRVLDVTGNRLLGVVSDSLGVQSVLVYDLLGPRPVRDSRTDASATAPVRRP